MTNSFVEFNAGILRVDGKRVKMDLRKIFPKDETGKATKTKIKKVLNYVNRSQDILESGSDLQKVLVINKLEKKIKKQGLKHIAGKLSFEEGQVFVTMPRNAPEISFPMAEAALKREFSLTMDNCGFSKTLRTYHRLMKLVSKADGASKQEAMQHAAEFMSKFTPAQNKAISDYYAALNGAKRYFKKRGYTIGSFMK